MELYKASGILSYDLSTPAQTKNGSLYFLKELFKKYRPKVIVYDVSPLFFPFSGETDYSYRDIIDNLPMSRNKLELLSAYAESTSYRTDVSYNEAYLNGLVPLFYYHDRWSQLTAQNFKFAEDKNYFAYGQYLSCNIVPAAFSVDVMNSSATRMENNSAVEKTVYVMGEQMEESVPALPLYQAEITEESWKILQEMSQLCSENGSELYCSNVDFYSGFIYDLLGIPEELFTPMFVNSRIVGWGAHRLEEMRSGARVMHPAFPYVFDRF